ncbi:MAG: O-antigen ligase family protein [bacterium]|nr:O-antigen ligase family protein [bacterium]
MLSDKLIANVLKGLLIATLLIPPFVVAINVLYFPFVTGKAYLFRFLVEVSLALWIFLALRSREYWPRLRSPVMLGTLAFLVGLIVAGFLGVDPVNSFFSGTERSDGVIQFAHWVLYLVMLVALFKSKGEWRRLLKIFVGLGFALATYAWFADWIIPSVKAVPRLQGSFGNPAYMGAFMLFAIGVAGLLAVPRRENSNSKQWLGWIALASFFTLTLIFTQTRGAYLGLVAGLGLLTCIVILLLRDRYKKLGLTLAGIAFGAVIIVSSLFAFQESQFVKSYSVLSRIASFATFTQSGSYTERINGWKVAVEAFKDKPVFGWGPENFGSAFNYHYDFRATQVESWFDRPHNQFLQVLAEGGIFLFSLYLFWISAIFYAIFRIFKKRKLTGAILASAYLAFLVQDMALFDTYPLYLGLFPLLGFIYFTYESGRGKMGEAVSHPPTRFQKTLSGRGPSAYVTLSALIAVALLTSFYTVWLPYKANSLVVKFYNQLAAGQYGAAQEALDRSTNVNSPYTWLDSRKNSGWVFINLLGALEGDKSRLNETNYRPLVELYRFNTARLEEALAYRPLDQQIYFLLGKTYRLGAEVLGQTGDLAKGEVAIQKGRAISPDRAEYVNELVKIWIDEGRFNEAEALLREHQARVKPDPPDAHAALGHFYFFVGGYDLAMQ